MILPLALLFVLESHSANPANGARFTSEVVRMEVHAGRLVVHGHYEFLSNGGDRSIPILYPFAMDSLMGEAKVVRMTPQPSGRDASGVHVRVPFDEQGRGQLEIEYEQALRGRRAVYLLRTTQEWGRPLDRATFEVDWPDSLGEPRFDFPLCATSHREARTLYRYQAETFLPEKDLRVEW